MLTTILRTHYIKTLKKIIKVSENTSVDLLKWFKNNGMKANADKYHLLVNSTEKVCTKIGPYNTESSEQQKLIGVISDNKVTFDKHINNFCAKASQKVNALCRVSSFMITNNKRLVMKAFTNSQFSYCPLKWINNFRTLNNKINRIHERSLRVVYNDKKATFKELLDKDKAVSMHTRNLQILVTEMFKVKIGESPSITHENFKTDDSNNFNFRKNRRFKPGNPKTVYYGTETISDLAPKLWIILPDGYKNSTSLKEFKSKVKNWVPLNCPCRLCKTYIQNVGFT